MKILNLYAGIGGNRKLWGDEHEITAVEYDQPTADVYKEYFPKDEMVVGDAHAYLLENYKTYDFIWSSPPCPTHSRLKKINIIGGQDEVVYPNMMLYQEIILLQNFAPKKTFWVVENVKPYYDPLIKAQERARHLFWTNFFIPEYDKKDNRIHNDIKASSVVYGFDISKTKIKNKTKALRNMVDPELAKYIFNAAIRQQPTFFNYEKENP